MPPFFAPLSLLVPFEAPDGKVNLLCLILNFVLTAYLINWLIRCIDAQFRMQDYLFTRTKKERAVLKSLWDCLKRMGLLLLMKLFADLLFSQPAGAKNVPLFLWMTLSAFLTAALWTCAAFLLKLWGVPSRGIQLSFTAAILLMVYGSSVLPWLTVFIPASPHFASMPMLYCLIKAGLFLPLSGAVYLRSKTYEAIK